MERQLKKVLERVTVKKVEPNREKRSKAQKIRFV